MTDRASSSSTERRRLASMTADDLRAEIARIFNEARDRALALVEVDAAALAVSGRPKARWLRLKEAAAACGWHPDTMAAKARMHGLGRRDGRVWWIDMRRVGAWRDGKPYERLNWEVSASFGQYSDDPDDASAAS